jgi:hypothetical protein
VMVKSCDGDGDRACYCYCPFSFLFWFILIFYSTTLLLVLCSCSFICLPLLHSCAVHPLLARHRRQKEAIQILRQ